MTNGKRLLTSLEANDVFLLILLERISGQEAVNEHR